MEIIDALPMRRFVKIKRKATESVDESWIKQKEIKRCKYVGSSVSGSADKLKELIIGKTPQLASPEDFEVIDYDVFISEVGCGDKKDQLPKENEVISCNGVPLIPAPANGANDEEDEDGKYIYDVYWFEGGAEENLVQETFDEEHREIDYSSNDEDNPENDYPDEDGVKDHCYGKQFEDDYQGYDPETTEMMKEFEKNCLGSSSSDDDCDEYSREDNDGDEPLSSA